MSSLLNGYDTEAGFLNGFTEKEQEAICIASQVTNGVSTEDKVFLLSSEELVWLQEADVNKNATPTALALEQDKTDWYEIYALELGVEDYFWWLRDKNAENHYEVYVVGNSYSGKNLKAQSAGLEGYGVRPAIVLDLQSEWAKEYKGEEE